VSEGETPNDDLDLIMERYERCELVYLSCVYEGADRDSLAKAAEATAEVAGAWEGAAYTEFFKLRDELGGESRKVIQKEIEAEQGELLAGLWRDLHAAHCRSDPRFAKPS